MKLPGCCYANFCEFAIRNLRLLLNSCLYERDRCQDSQRVELYESGRQILHLSPVHKNSSTSDFFIPTFDRFGDRSNRSDEPPDTGIFARLPKPKPPTFPPQSASQPQVTASQSGIPKLSRNYPETISSHRRWQQHPASPIASGG